MNHSKILQITKKHWAYYDLLHRSWALGTIVAWKAISLIKVEDSVNNINTAEYLLSCLEWFPASCFTIEMIQNLIDCTLKFHQDSEVVQIMQNRIEILKPIIPLAQAQNMLSDKAWVDYIGTIQEIIDLASSFPQNTEAVEILQNRLDELKSKNNPAHW